MSISFGSKGMENTFLNCFLKTRSPNYCIFCPFSYIREGGREICSIRAADKSSLPFLSSSMWSRKMGTVSVNHCNDSGISTGGDLDSFSIKDGLQRVYQASLERPSCFMQLVSKPSTFGPPFNSGVFL